jgi:hypothetical protein
LRRKSQKTGVAYVMSKDSLPAQEAADTSAAVNDERGWRRPRTCGRGGGWPTPPVVEVLADAGEDAGSVAYSDAGGIAVLYDDEARFTVVVKHIQLAHLVFLDEIPKLDPDTLKVIVPPVRGYIFHVNSSAGIFVPEYNSYARQP